MKQQFPRSARDTLARQPAPDEHLSADLLNGFLERALAAEENARVTAHLASCADCRDVVFLASAANPDEQRVVSPNPASVWARRGTWKWLVPALAALAIVSGVMIERRWNSITRSRAQATVAMDAPAAETRMQARDAAPNELNSAASKYSSDVKKEQLKKADSASRESQQSKARTLPSTGLKDQHRTELAQAAPQSVPLNGLPSGAWPTTPPSAMAKAASPAPAAPPPQSAAIHPRQQSQTVEVTSAAPLVQADNADLQAESKAANPTISAANPAGIPSQAPAEAATIAGQPTSPSSSSGASGRNISGMAGNSLSLAKRAVSTHWRISSEGHLERSTASGPWTPVLADQPVSFRAVASIGIDVWAGGSGGALFHSPDAGEHWTRVALIADGQPEKGAVASIRFDTPAEGRVTNDAGATWSTQDGGQTWTRQ